METQNVEFKDYSKVEDKKAELKKMKSQLFKEISAFANSGGGRLIIGINDKTEEKVPQPLHVLKLVDNETLSN